MRRSRIPLKARMGCLIGVVVLVGLTFCLWWLNQNAFLRPYSSETLKAQWTADGTVGKLKLWADEVIHSGRFPQQKNWPEVPEPAFIYTAYLIRDRDDRVIAVALEMGSADNHHGLVIGQRPDGFSWIRHQWEKGVWWYDEVPRMDERAHRKLSRKAR